MKYILGINSAYHESAACLISDGEIIAFAEEERFNRTKHGKTAKVDNPDVLPLSAIDYCIKSARISLKDISYFGYSFDPDDRLRNLILKETTVEGDWGSQKGEELFRDKLLTIPARLSNLAGEDITHRFHWVKHHVCHAGSAFFVSPFEQAAILSVDGIGEFTTTFLGLGQASNIEAIKEITYPNSIGLLWEKVSKYIGFSEYDAAKVMGLAAYGNPSKYLNAFRRILKIEGNGGFIINNEITNFRTNDFSSLEELLGRKRDPGEDISERHADIAAALQRVTEDAVLTLTNYLEEQTKCENLCIAGGVGLNCLMNSVVMDRGAFRNLYIQPASHDAGTAVGAAFYIWNQILGQKRSYVMDTAYLGPEYSELEIVDVLQRNDIKYLYCDDIEKRVAELISQGKIVGWFQGSMEGGPRGLGNRSLLADPRNPHIRDILNTKVKHREYFRPFAPSVLEEKADDWFTVRDKQQPFYFMLMVCHVRPNKKNLIPAVLHVDGTSRIHLVQRHVNLKYHRVIEEFEKLTSIPLVLNTSFNDREPIVCSPQDAVNTFMRTRIDALALGNYLVLRGAE
jgi:carbamoyltransferase